MEPGVREYLLRIVHTLSFGVLWMTVNSTAGIMYHLAFIEEKIQLKNVLFYLFLIISLAVLLWYIIRLWSKPIDYEQ
ncbi:MAG: hypothetical protein K2Q21_12685 [Chitinophagaceae bacterium]|nr:hypothetical protein [Chitinophagaceae bacterium]